MKMAYKRVLVSLPEELLEAVDQAAQSEHRKRNEFVREALRDRIRRTTLQAALERIQTAVKNDYPEEEVDRDIEQALSEVRAAQRARPR